jgi:lipid A 3-O-deacylase
MLTAISIQTADAEDKSPAEQVLIDASVDQQPPPEVSDSVISEAAMPQAGVEAGECEPPAHRDVYHRRQWSVSYLTGFSGINLGPAPVPFSMLPEIVRFNRVFNDPRPDRRLKGSFEWVFELDTLPVVNGPASIVIGGSALLRYNFGTYKHKRLVPYCQIGGGGMYTDAFLYRRGVLSTGFEFIINAGGGCNYFLTDHLALTLEWSYFHFSNSGIVLPNIGVNEVGALVGLTYFFRRSRCR